MIVYITDNKMSHKQAILNLFGDMFSDVHKIEQNEFDALVEYSSEKGWTEWERIWGKWKEKGYIPFEDY